MTTTPARVRRRQQARRRRTVDILLANLTGGVLAAGLLIAYLATRGHIAW